MESEYSGKIVRYLMENHNKNRLVPKDEIKKLFLIRNEIFESVLVDTQDFLLKIGLEMAGINSNTVVPLKEAKKLFLRKINDDVVSKKFKISPSVEDTMMYMAFAAIQLENDRFEESKFEILQKSAYFNNVNIRDVFAKYKMDGYLKCYKENDLEIWSLGWRFYVEYCDSFDVLDYFKNNGIGEAS